MAIDLDHAWFGGGAKVEEADVFVRGERPFNDVVILHDLVSGGFVNSNRVKGPV